MSNELNDVFRLTARFDPANSASEVENIYYYKLTDAVDLTDGVIVAECADIIDSLMSNVAAYFATDYNAVSCYVVNCTKRERLGTGVPDFVGLDNSTQELPAQCAVEILQPIKALGRTARKYLGPPTELCQDQSTISGAALAAFQAFADEMDDVQVGASGNNYTPGIARFAAGGILSSFDPFIAAVGRAVNIMRTQRRRTPGFGLS